MGGLIRWETPPGHETKARSVGSFYHACLQEEGVQRQGTKHFRLMRSRPSAVIPHTLPRTLSRFGHQGSRAKSGLAAVGHWAKWSAFQELDGFLIVLSGCRPRLTNKSREAQRWAWHNLGICRGFGVDLVILTWPAGQRWIPLCQTQGRALIEIPQEIAASEGSGKGIKP